MSLRGIPEMDQDLRIGGNDVLEGLHATAVTRVSGFLWTHLQRSEYSWKSSGVRIPWV